MYYSYVMGIKNSRDKLVEQGFVVEEIGNDLGLSFNESMEDEWKKFIYDNLSLGFWNEYLNKDKAVFIFHLDTGFVEYTVKNYDNSKVLNLCEKLCNRSFESIRFMLEGNNFYQKNVFGGEVNE